MAEEPTERDKYIEGLEEKLRKAGRAKRFLDNEDGGLITEWATGQVNRLMKQIAGKALLDKPQEYAYAVGELNSYQKLLTMLNSEASADVEDINSRIKEAKNDV